tara:strand:- start:1194 stop:1754 length:561 start_codon:yes stop_codon:yes gene_type:complete
MNRNQHNGGRPGLTMPQTLRQPHSAVNDYNYNRLSNRAGGPSHSQRMANVNRVMNNNNQNNTLVPQKPMGAFLTRQQAPMIPPALGGGNWTSSILYGGLAGLLVSVVSNRKTETARRNRGIGLILASGLTGFALREPGQMVPHAPSILGAGLGYIVAANLLGMRIKYPSPLQQVLPSWAVRAGGSK